MTTEESLRRAVEFHNAGQLQQAGELYQAILQSDPRHAVANHNMGRLAVEMNEPGAALPFLETALDVDPARAQFWLTYIDALDRAGQQEDARKILALARQQGLEGEQVELLEARIATGVSGTTDNGNPAPADIHLLSALFNQRHFSEAEALAQSLTRHFPAFGPAWRTLGAVLHQRGANSEALEVLQTALTLMPRDAMSYFFLGNALSALEQLWESVVAYRKAVEFNPDFAEAYHNLGASLQDLRRHQEAEDCFRRSLEINPNNPDAWRNLANVLKDLGRLAEAMDCCRRGLAIAPQDAVLHQTLATQLAHLSDFRQVVAESDTALSLNPESRDIWEQRLYTLSYHPDLSAPQIFAEFVRWGERYPAPASDFSTHDRTPGRRLRVGFVSPDFRRHTSRFYFWPMFSNHDHSVVEMFAYSNVLNEDEATSTFKTMFDHWRNIRGVSDQDAARMIRADRIDILVDGCNHMQDDRLGIFALKPAPIQVTWLGAAWTTGLKQIDYVLFDPHIAPAGTLSTECIVRLPHCFVAYQPEREPAVAPTPAMRNGYITFGYSGRSERLNHHTFRIWAEIMHRMPNSKLILDYRIFSDPRTQIHYRDFMRGQGIDPERVVMRRSADILEGLSEIDVLLDCFPHSGGTMLIDALWMGVPCLTLTGRPPLGRIGTTFLTNLGMTDWIATSYDDYIKKAVALTHDVAALNAIRANLRTRMKASPLMDGKRFAHDVEVAYREMYKTWIARE